MSKRNRICLATVFFAAFAVWTVAVCFVDVQSIGPQGSAVGFATVNSAFHRLTDIIGGALLTPLLSVVLTFSFRVFSVP
jgi:hypothetical protein